MDKNNTQEQLQNAIMDFVTDYGLLGFMTALPTTPDFITYHAVYLLKIILLRKKAWPRKNIFRTSFHLIRLILWKKGWNLHGVRTMCRWCFLLCLTDEKSSLKVCKHCGKAFVASRPNSVFCSGKCKNRYNVYKSQAKNKDNTNSPAIRKKVDYGKYKKEKLDNSNFCCYHLFNS